MIERPAGRCDSYQSGRLQVTQIPEWVWMILAIPTILSLIGGIALWMNVTWSRWRWKRRRRRGLTMIRLPTSEQIREQADSDGGAQIRPRRK